MKEFLCKLRAHHGMCLAFFQGKGYSSDFTRHMAQVQQQLCANPSVCIVDELDAICDACPNHAGGMCDAQEKVAVYDRQVLHRCGLKSGTVMPFADFQKLVYDRILVSGKREEICGDCQWTQLCHLRNDQ